MIKEIWSALKEAVGMIFDMVYTPTSIYISGLKKLIINSIIATLALLGISILFALFNIYWPLKLSIIIIGFIFIVLLIAIFPILTLASIGQEKVPAIKRVVQLCAAIVFWIFQMMIYFSIVPIQNAPVVIPLVLLLFAAIAFGFVAYGFKGGINPKWAIIRTVAILCLVTFYLFVPQTHEYITLAAEKINEKITGQLKAPRAVEYQSSLAFFNSVTGEPKVWFCKRGDGGFDLFDRPGFHPGTGEKLQPVTLETESQILEWQKKEEERQKEEREKAERDAKQKEEMIERQKMEAAAVEQKRQQLEAEERAKAEKELAQRQTEEKQKVQQEQQAQIPQTSQPSTESQQKITIPRNTSITVRLPGSLSTDKNRSGQEFFAYLMGPLVAEGFVIAERNAEVKGVIVELKKAGRIRGVSSLSFRLVEIKAANGMIIDVKTNILKIEGKASKGSDIAKILGGAAAGAVIGTLAGGKKTAAESAVAGSAAGTTVVLATRGKSLELPSETVLRFYLTEPTFLPR